MLFIRDIAAVFGKIEKTNPFLLFSPSQSVSLLMKWASYLRLPKLHASSDKSNEKIAEFDL